MRTVNVGLVGLGTVGSGVVRILQDHHDDFVRRAGVDVRLTRCSTRTLSKAASLGLPEGVLTADAADIINDPEIDIVVELIGGTGVAHDLVLSALAAGKHVITANKALMATYGEEVLDAAARYGVEIAFEGAVGGGIPIIGPLKHSLTSNEIQSVYGIVNGTTNYMLTRMGDDGLDYATALAEAQEKGFAEADPTADVDGLDAAAKIAILASIAFNSRVKLGDIAPEGIRSISPVDLAYAEEMGYVIKLLAIARRTEGEIDVRVHPTMIPKGHALASVNGVYNAIYVIGDYVGETMFFGEGAGSRPAASAVVGDLIEVARHVAAGIPPLVGCTCTEHLPIRNMNELVTKYYVRLRVADQPGVLAKTAAVFAEKGVSIYSMVQRGSCDESAELVYVTHKACEADMRSALKSIAELDVVKEVATLIRVEDI